MDRAMTEALYRLYMLRQQAYLTHKELEKISSSKGKRLRLCVRENGYSPIRHGDGCCRFLDINNLRMNCAYKRRVCVN